MHSPFAVTLTALIGVSSALASTRASTRQRAVDVESAPAEVLEYYQDHNFVTAFSTPRERQLLARQPAPAGDHRLSRVAHLMRGLEDRVEGVDPGMVRDRSQAAPVTVRSTLLRIESVRIDADAGEAWIELEGLSFGPPENVFFLSRVTTS